MSSVSVSPTNVPTATPAPPLPRIQMVVVGLALALFAVVVWQASAYGWRLPALAAIGGGLGAVLYLAAFGFSAAYRNLFEVGTTPAVEAHLLLLALTMLLVAPLLAQGELFGRPLHGAVAPMGVQVAFGAFLFGVGMQLAGGCASGTLYSVGGGNLRMAVTLSAFCAGAFWGSLHLGFWGQLPQTEALALGELLGWPAAIALQFTLIALAWIALRRIGRHARQVKSRQPGATHWRGHWPLVRGVVALALLNAATLVVAGHPWAITWGYTLWGAKAAAIAGWSPDGTIWAADYFRNALDRDLLSDTVSIMNVGILIGALFAAGLSGRWSPGWRVPMRSFAAAAIGGMMLGYGARLAFGCNIGAFISGIASTSMHGWLWILCALPGNWIGVKLRPVFGLGKTEQHARW